MKIKAGIVVSYINKPSRHMRLEDIINVPYDPSNDHLFDGDAYSIREEADREAYLRFLRKINGFMSSPDDVNKDHKN